MNDKFTDLVLFEKLGTVASTVPFIKEHFDLSLVKCLFEFIDKRERQL